MSIQGGCCNSLETMPYNQACISPSINASLTNLLSSFIFFTSHGFPGAIRHETQSFTDTKKTVWGSGTSQSRTCEFEDAAGLTDFCIQTQNHQDWDQAGLRKCTFGPGLLFSIPLRHLAVFSAIIPPLSASVKHNLSSCGTQPFQPSPMPMVSLPLLP